MRALWDRTFEWLESRLGLRGTAMLILGVGWILLGYSVLDQLAGRPPGAFHTLFPHWFAVGMWWATGVLALVTAFTEKLDYIGIALLTVMPMIRTLSFFGAWIFGVLPDWVVEILPGDPIEGSPSAWLSATLSALLLSFVFIVANIRQGPVPPPDVPHDPEDG